MDCIYILAQSDTVETSTITTEPATEQENQALTTIPADPNAPAGAPQGPKSSPFPQMILLGLMFVVFYLLLFRGPRKKQQKHKQMVQTLSKNDKVRTIGGVIGTVVDIKDDIITLKVDESNNTKIKIVSSAIGKNLTKDQGE